MLALLLHSAFSVLRASQPRADQHIDKMHVFIKLITTCVFYLLLLCSYGSSSSTGPCHKCPMDTWSAGTAHEPCKPCPHGTASPSGATDAKHCVPYSKICGTGGYLMGKGKSLSHCGCFPGYGMQKGDAYEAPHCMMCPAGKLKQARIAARQSESLFPTCSTVDWCLWLQLFGWYRHAVKPHNS